MSLVFPSYFKIDKPADALDFLSNNITLKVGQVVKANFPDASKNKNSFITYDVFYSEQQGKEIYNNIAYDCTPVQVFGSAADYVEFSYRANVSEDGNQDDVLTEGAVIDLSSNDDAKKLMGAAVLIAFLGGDTSNGIILGAVPNFFLDKNKQYTFQSKDIGKFFNFAFNGIKVNINNDGELLLVVNGPTLDEGKLDTDASDKKKVGSFIKINKEGEIIISTTTKTEEEDGFIKPPDVDKADNKITIKKDGSIEIKIDDKSSFTLKKTDKDAELTLGDGAKSVAVAEELKDLYGKLKDYIEGAKVPTGMGPSGTIQAGSGPAPSWNDNIVSNKMKLPKN
jgi:phage gp45-like